MDEFSIIHKYLAPLCKNTEGAFGLKDDAALLPPLRDEEWVVTTDAIAEGVHFLSKTDPALIAQKLLRVNLSDLSAKGATPKYYSMTLALPNYVDEAWIRRFTSGLANDQKKFGIALIGGDTIRVKGKLCLSATMMGVVKKGKMIARTSARAGDIIYVTGTIGDAALGLKVVQKKLSQIPASQCKFLETRYHVPEPRVDFLKPICSIVSAAMDISDGLLADMEHMAKAANILASIKQEAIPLSPAAHDLVERTPRLWQEVISGGDDYEIIFTASHQYANRILLHAKKMKLRVSPIGRMKRGHGLELLDMQDKLIAISKKGYVH